MKNSIFQINQSEALKFKEKHKLNLEDFILLRKIHDYSISQKSIKVSEKGIIYTWINYEAIQKEFPLIFVSVTAIKKRVYNLSQKGILNNKVHVVKKTEIGNHFKTYGVFSIIFLEPFVNKLFILEEEKGDDKRSPLAIQKGVNGQLKKDNFFEKEVVRKETKIPPNGSGGYTLEGSNKETLKRETLKMNSKEKKDKKKEKTAVLKPKQSNFDSFIKTFTESTDLQEEIREFIQMRKLIKKPMTEVAIKRLLKKLDKLAIDDDSKIEILGNSIINSWSDIYGLKNKFSKSKQHNGNPKETYLDKKLRELREAKLKEVNTNLI